MFTLNGQHGIHGVYWSLIDYRPVQAWHERLYNIHWHRGSFHDWINMTSCKSSKPHSSELLNRFITILDTSKLKLNNKNNKKTRAKTAAQSGSWVVFKHYCWWIYVIHLYINLLRARVICFSPKSNKPKNYTGKTYPIISEWHCF